MSGTAHPTARDIFLAKLMEEIPAENRQTFDADPRFENAPPGIDETGPAALFAVPQVSSYMCTTQRTLSSIVIGMGNSIPRWKKHQEIKWAALKVGYPSEAHARYATYKLAQATKDWNDCEVGVTFKWVSSIDEATFVLEYGGNKGNVLAEAFFPNSDPLSSLFVYKSAFTQENLPILKNIFLHELGHVLGLRHEFALESEKSWAALRFGTPNPVSVMSYTFPPTIQDSDKEDTKLFYSYDRNAIGGIEIIDWVAN
ncbi:hypothetical protein B0I37DRAFT_193461 [Chaetomium sp. MPI-CAGE-AT-0009]|nr:hypothetical protein B0I37DRAFT_193461 [Chaetomium sp. MPI-CAGE-AT-0009]